LTITPVHIPHQEERGKDERTLMREKVRLPGLLIAIWSIVFLVHASLYLALIPLWQAPDEPTSFELLLTMEATGRLVSEADKDFNIQRGIVDSMERSRYWERGGHHYGHPRSGERTFDRVYWPGVTQLHRPPLYQGILMPVGWLMGDWTVEERLLVLRGVTMFLGVGVVVIAALIGWELRQIHRAFPLVLPALVALQPQFAYSNATFNSDNLAAFIGALLTLLVLNIVRFGISWKRVLIVLVLVSAGLATKRTILFVTPAVFLVLLYSQWHRWRTSPGYRLPIIAGVIALSTVIFFAAASSSVRSGFAVFLSQYVVHGYLDFVLNRYLNPAEIDWHWLGTKALPFLSRSSWGSYGWHQVAISSSLQAVFHIIVPLIGIAGIVTMFVKRPAMGSAACAFVWTCMLGSLATIWLVIQYVPPPGFPQGRYLFVMIISIMVWITTGISGWWPTRWTAQGILVVWGLLIALNIHNLVVIVIPGFYH
jgi:hypothetical protein